MSGNFQEIAIFQYGLSGNIIRQVGVAVFGPGDLTPDNLIMVASSYDWRDGNYNGSVDIAEWFFGLDWVGRNQLMMQVASQMLAETADPDWNDIRNKVFFETAGNIVSELAERFLTDAVVGPLAGAIGDQIARSVSSNKIVQLIIADQASSILDDYLSESLGFGERPTTGGLEIVVVDQVSGYSAVSSVDHLLSILPNGGQVNLAGGSDFVYGSGGVDTIYSGSGNDSVFAGASSDTVYGGNGNDDLRGEDGADLLRGEADSDTLYGGGGNDDVYGDEGTDLLKGETGNDVLRGGLGSDQLFGDENDDRLIGEDGNDTLDGGAGYDTAVFALSFSNYAFSFNASNGNYTVRALSGLEGTDTLVRVETITFGSSSGTVAHWLGLAGGAPAPAPSPIDTTPYVPPSSDNTSPDGVANSALSVTPVSKQIIVGQSVALSQLFPQSGWVDNDGASDIRWVAVQDRTAGGGYLTYNGNVVAANTVHEFTVAELANWRFVAASGAAVDQIGFNIIQADGDFSPRLTTGAVVTTVVPVSPAPASPTPIVVPGIEVAHLDLDLREGSSAEEGSRSEFTIQRRGNQEGDIVVEWRIEGIGENPVDRRDFPAMSGTVTLYDERGDRNFSIGVSQDQVDEFDEQFRIELRVVSGDAVFDDDDANFTIIDDDEPLGIDPNVDDHGNTFATATVVGEDQWARGFIEQAGDQDYFRFDLLGGVGYEFILYKDDDLSLIGGDPDADYPTLPQPIAELYNSGGQLIATVPATNISSRWAYQYETAADGTYYLRVRENGDNDVGQYFVRADIRVQADDFVGSTATLGRLEVGGIAVGHHERSIDDDWFEVSLDAGSSYRFIVFSDERLLVNEVVGENGWYYFGWDDAAFSVRDANGAIVQVRNENYPTSDNLIEFSPTITGNYYVSVASDSIGSRIYDYRVLAQEVVQRPVVPALILQPGSDKVTDVRFAGIRDQNGPAIDDETLTVNYETTSSIIFDLSGISTNASYAAIEIYLFASANATPGDVVVDIPGAKLDASSTFGDIGSIEFVTAVPNPVVGQWVTIEITDLYNSWISGERPNNGIMLSTSETSSALMSFYSSNYQADPTLRPRLILDGPDITETAYGQTTGSLGENQGSVSGEIGLTGNGEGFAGATAKGNWGTITVDDAGRSWTYELDARADALKQGQSVDETLTLTSASGVSQTIKIAIAGENDSTVVVGAGTQEFDESSLSLSGASLLFDVDATIQPTFVAGSFAGAYGQFRINSIGEWNYALSVGGMLALGTGDSETENFTAHASDGSTLAYSIVIAGTDNDWIDLSASTSSQNISGGTGNDTIFSGSGIDSLSGGAGNDTIDGGEGEDVAIYLGDRSDFNVTQDANGTVRVTDIRAVPSEGSDQLIDVEKLEFGGVIYSVAQLLNNAPTIENIIADQVATEDQAFAFQFADDAFGDADAGTVLTYSATKADGNPLPNWLVFNPATRTFSGTPADANVGTLAVRVTASDGFSNIDQVFDINIADVVDTIFGNGANNILSGTAFADTIDGLGGNDTIAGLAGADSIFGGSGSDRATYSASSFGVSISLMTGLGTRGDAEGDALVSIENLTGSRYADTLEGNGGKNLLNGGLGRDTVSYEHAAAGVRVSLALTAAQNTVGAGTDTLTRFENLTGSALNDRLTGSIGNNVLRGLAGNDRIIGGAGVDRIEGGFGNDVLSGGTGGDTFVFKSTLDGSDVVTDFVSKTDHLSISGLLDDIGLDGVSYATLVAQGNLIVETGKFTSGTTTNSAALIDTRIYADQDGAGLGARVLIATLEDTRVLATDFIL